MTIKVTKKIKVMSEWHKIPSEWIDLACGWWNILSKEIYFLTKRGCPKSVISNAMKNLKLLIIYSLLSLRFLPNGRNDTFWTPLFYI